MNQKFDFKRYQNSKISWRILFRLLVYIAVISFLLYLIFYQNKGKAVNTDENTIEEFQIETDDQWTIDN